MNETTFWQMIEQAKIDSGGEDMQQVDLLVERLAKLQPSEILDFARFYYTFDGEADRLDLWNAAYIVNGGCSQNGFDDFRAWLIAQGKDTYLSVLEEPDNLAEIVTVEITKYRGKWGNVMGSLWVVARRAWEVRTGQEMLPTIQSLDTAFTEILWTGSDNIIGEDIEYLKERFPRITAKFWDEADFESDGE